MDGRSPPLLLVTGTNGSALIITEQGKIHGTRPVSPGEFRRTAHVDKRPQVWRKNQDVLMPQGREAASTVVGGILALAAGALSRPVAAPWQWWGICLLAVSNLSAGVLIGFQLARRASCLVQEGARKR